MKHREGFLMMCRHLLYLFSKAYLATMQLRSLSKVMEDELHHWETVRVINNQVFLGRPCKRYLPLEHSQTLSWHSFIIYLCPKEPYQSRFMSKISIWICKSVGYHQPTVHPQAGRTSSRILDIQSRCSQFLRHQMLLLPPSLLPIKLLWMLSEFEPRP